MPMRARWIKQRGVGRGDYLSDALTLLDGWIRDGWEIRRTLRLDDAQHAALTERIKIAADTLQLRPEIRRRDGHTQIRLGSSEEAGLTAGEVALAARIEDAYRAIVGTT
jgi:4a-hydroxytetrahydrobiopterin dehydratase